MSKLTLAITGAAGFLGRTLTPVLRDDPAVGRVIALDLERGETEGVEWVAADVRDRALADKLRGVDVVVHLAFVVLGDLRQADDINVRGSANVFEAAANAGCRRLVHASSVAAYGYGVEGRFLTEDDPIRPIEAFTYSRTKGAAERALLETIERHPELEVAWLRPSIILGPRNHDFLETLMSRRAVIRPGRNAGGIQFVHIDDVVEAFRLATVGRATGAFNVSGSGSVSYEELAEIAGKRLVTVPRRAALGFTGAAGRMRPKLGVDAGWVMIAQRPPLVSTIRAERELGWRPTRSSREAIEEFLRGSVRLATGRR
jgi:nucleoside-diphosphate-sugar epimerase